MPAPAQSSVRNRLLSLMAAEDFDRLAPHLEFVQLPKGRVLSEPDAPIQHAHLLDSGLGSIVSVSPEGLEVKAGVFGRDGMTPTALLMGAETTSPRILIQIEDDAWRIARAPLMDAFDASPGLRRLLLRYAHTLVVQIGFTALSNAVHPIDERLARWILMCDDRSDGHELRLTHEFMSIMLAVRRPSVTTSLHVLEGNGFIRAERGRIIVRDRAALEHFAGDAYGKAEAVYREMLGPMG